MSLSKPVTIFFAFKIDGLTTRLKANTYSVTPATSHPLACKGTWKMSLWRDKSVHCLLT